MAHKQACDVCHKRKIQCDSTDQKKPCNWCEHHGLACTFDRVRGRRKKREKARGPDPATRSGLSERLQRLEETIAHTLQQRTALAAASGDSTTSRSASPPSAATSSVDKQPDTPATSFHSPSSSSKITPNPTNRPFYVASPLGGDTTSVAFGQIHFGGCHFGKISHHNGMPMLSEEGRQWMSSRTGENVSFERFRPVATQNAWMDGPGFLIDGNELPDRTITEMALEGYLNAACRLIFPMVDGVLFRDVIAEAYDETEGQIPMSRLTAKCCVLAFLSIAFLFRTSTSPMPDMDSDTFAMRAHQYLPDVMEDNSLVGLQAMFMLNLYQASTGRLQAAAMLHAIACRSVFMLGGHAYRPIKPYTADIGRQERESRQLRLLFWLCYIFDKDISLRMNQPPLMSEDYCDMTLPEGYVNSYLFLPDTDANLSSRLDFDKNPFPLFPGELRLCQFKDKATRLLYSAQAVNKSEAELFQNIRELDDELERWRLSIIPEYRPSLSINEMAEECIMNGSPGPMRGMRRIVMHLEYHHLMTTIHRASGRCSVAALKGNPENPGMMGGVSSSIELTIEASRSTLVFLRTATRHLEAAAFWAMVFYPTAAIMAIFLNILEHPLAPTVESDLKLLASAASTIRAMPKARLTRRELAHLDMMDEFVAELVRLGNRAIQMELLRTQQDRGNGCVGC